MKKGRNLQVSAKHIGLMAIVSDNSYIHFFGDKNTKNWGEVELANKQVKIHSKPFTLTFKLSKHNAHPLTREFVTVQYNGHLFNVFNDFKEIIISK